MTAVVFDLGNVVLGWSPLNLYRKVFETEDHALAFMDDVEIHKLNELFDQGVDPSESTAEWIERHPKWESELRMFWDRWPETLTDFDTEVAALIDEIKGLGHQVLALSNFGVATWERQTDLSPYERFDGIVLSGREGVTKPNTRIYEIVEERYGVSGAAVFFTDDKPENVAAAMERGWAGHVFVGVDELRCALRSAGVAVSADV